jgi:hypothetical protein
MQDGKRAGMKITDGVAEGGTGDRSMLGMVQGSLSEIRARGHGCVALCMSSANEMRKTLLTIGASEARRQA